MKKLRIQFMSQIPGNYREKQKAHLHFVPYYLEKLGHKIDIIQRKHWLAFYIKYLLFSPDVMIVSGLIGFLPILLKKIGLIRKPIIYYWGDYFHEAMGLKWGVDKCAFLEFFCAKNASFITTPSKFLENLCDIIGIKNVKYIPHGVIENINQIKANPLNELNEKQKKLLKFVYLGDVEKYKKTNKIIDAVINKSCILYIIGKANDKELLKNLPENVIYLEEMPHEKAISYVKACDIAVITSDQDSTLKMFEYLAMCKPILAFNGRINYVLTHCENAYLTSDFNKGVDKLIKNKKLCSELSQNSKNFKVYKWHEIGNLYNKLFREL
jgi:hypothetical protein